MHALRHGRRFTHAEMFGLTMRPALYERHARWVAGRLYRRVAADVAAAGLPAGAVVLDVGTGPGVVPRLIAAAAPALRVEGVDLSAAMIEHARQAAASNDDRGPAYRTADVAELPQPDGSVDLVVSSLSLHHWSDPAAGLREVQRVLTPGGRAWIYDIRPAVRRALHTAQAQGINARAELPLVGTTRLNPVGRLVMS